MNWRDAAMEHAKRMDPCESCGLLVQFDEGQIYWPCRNMAESGAEFQLDPLDYAAAEDSGTVLAVIHSHPGQSVEPSDLDWRNMQLSALSWFIIEPRAGLWSDEYNPSLWAASTVPGAADLYG